MNNEEIKAAAKAIAEKVAKNASVAPQLCFPHIYLGLCEIFAAPTIPEPRAVAGDCNTCGGAGLFYGVKCSRCEGTRKEPVVASPAAAAPTIDSVKSEMAALVSKARHAGNITELVDAGCEIGKLFDAAITAARQQGELFHQAACKLAAENADLRARLASAGDEAACWRYVKATTTAVRDPATGERLECTPEEFEASVKAALARTTNKGNGNG